MKNWAHLVPSDIKISVDFIFFRSAIYCVIEMLYTLYVPLGLCVYIRPNECRPNICNGASFMSVCGNNNKSLTKFFHGCGLGSNFEQYDFIREVRVLSELCMTFWESCVFQRSIASRVIPVIPKHFVKHYCELKPSSVTFAIMHIHENDFWYTQRNPIQLRVYI